MAVALAYSEAEALQLVIQHPDVYAGDDFKKPPIVVDTPAAFLVWGGS